MDVAGCSGVPAVLTIYTNHPGEILDIKIKLLNSWWENDPLQCISKTAEQTKRVEEITSP